jgi:protein-L-isoaspartate O-methyltransferase
MINVQNLKDKLVPNDILGVFGITLSEDLVKNGYVIAKNPNFTHLFMFNPDGELVSTDNANYILGYATELLDVEFNSILIAGLGLGVMPYVCQDFAQVDVVEINQDIIDLAKQLGHLNENVNIIHDDILTFSVEKTYDIIVLDIWYDALTDELSNQIIEKYMPFINEGGFLYIPINKGVIDDKVVITK